MPTGTVWFIFVSCQYLIVTFYFKETSFVLICIAETVSAILDCRFGEEFFVKTMFCSTAIVQLCI